MKNSSFHLWFPDLFEFAGGIQVYSNFLIKALRDSHPKHKFEIFIKNDPCCSVELPCLKNTQFHCTGSWPLGLRTAIFASQITSYGLRQRPRLIISTHLNFAPAAYLLKYLTGIPYWVSAHGVDAWNITSPILQTALRHADRILPSGHYTRDRLLKEQNLDPNKIQILPNTFDSSRFQIAGKPNYLLERHQLRSNQPTILTVARLAKVEAYKGYDKIIKALPEVRHHLPNVHYLIVGKGDDRPRIEQLIDQLNLQDCVTLAGFIPDHELCDYYNLCDVFAMPSKGEGFGIVYLEALACGKPVLAGNQDGALDALCQGELGALVNPDDNEAIGHALIQLLQGKYPNPMLYQAQQLRQEVITRFGFERFKQTLNYHLEHYFQSI